MNLVGVQKSGGTATSLCLIMCACSPGKERGDGKRELLPGMIKIVERHLKRKNV